MVDTKMVAKELRAVVKKEFKGCKFSIRTKYNEVSVTLVSAPFEAFASLEYVNTLPPVRTHDGTHCQLNHYHIKQDHFDRWVSDGAHITEQCAKMFIRLCEVMDEHNYDRSERQVDYFDIGFYVHLSIGRWDKPFTVK
jgi:ribosomal protein S16